MFKMKNRAAVETACEDFIQLQPIGKIDRPPEVVAFWHICNLRIIQVSSMYFKIAPIYNIPNSAAAKSRAADLQALINNCR